MPLPATHSCDAGEVVVVEPEAPADRLAVGQVEHLGGGQALPGQLEQLGDDAEHRVGLAQRAVGQPDAQVRQAVVELVVLVARPPRRTWPG